jgi:SWI/SNF-related matrix-associated actin-dependent regulator of chromatin subfamily A member 5
MEEEEEDKDVHRHRRSEREADAEELVEELEEEEGAALQPAFSFTESPGYVEGGRMRDYQIQGLNWLINLYHHSINGILADEMGLGKTLQTLSLLGYLQQYVPDSGPHILIVPKSTLQNWHNEARRWVPSLRAFVFHGDKEGRAELIKTRLAAKDFDVCITSFETCMIERAALRKIHWQYLVIDEAHRIKNENSSLSQIVRLFSVERRLLLTGTPLQNNLHELWALLNFLLPDIFGSSADFDSCFLPGGDSGEHGKGRQGQLIEQLRRLLSPFLLRRLKADVEHSLLPKKEVNLYVGMSELQKRWYRRILEKDIGTLNGLVGGRGEGKVRLQNVLMQLRKCANHPYLFDGAEPGPPFTTDEHLVRSAGKMVVLDRLLARLKANGSRVLLFSQMSRVLDILEDYCQFRGHAYCRIDGQTPHEERIAGIEEYNRPGSDKFVFLLTTRAGGLGINLATADIVILYDSDWNPQVDLQAQDRAHRIGQQKQVCVFRLITENSVEEKVIERALQKLRLDQLVIQQGRLTNANKPLTQEEMLGMIRHGAEALFQGAGASPDDEVVDDAQMEEILRRGEARTKELTAKYQNAGLDDLQKFSMDAVAITRIEGGDAAASGAGGAFKFIEPPRRERKTHYSVDGYFREAMGIAARTRSTKAPMPRNALQVHDYQFFPEALKGLLEREILAHQQSVGYQVPEAPDEDGARRAERLQEQRAIDSAVALSEDELARKEALLAQGFPGWTRRDYQALLRAIERHGRADDATLAAEVEGKTEGEVRAYLAVFWERFPELADGDKIAALILREEARRARVAQVRALIAAKVRRHARSHFALPYFNGKGKEYTEEEDAFLLRTVDRLGYGPDDVFAEAHAAILAEPAFRFDWFFKTRTPLELSRRLAKLVGFLEREERESTTSAAPANAPSTAKSLPAKRPVGAGGRK